MESNIKYEIILFDGVCNLCNSSVNFVIKHDKKNRYRFAALQSDIGKDLVNQFGIDPNETDSIILIKGQKHYIRSSAALRVAKGLSGGYPLFYVFMIIPTFIRNWVYDYIAKNRYKWYGKRESCMIPTEELKSRFL